MNIKRIVLIALIIYVIGAVSVLFIGLVFGEPSPGEDVASSLLKLNTSVQDGIADRTNIEVEEIAKADTGKDTPDKVAPPTQTTTTPTTTTSATPSSTTTTPQTTPTPAPAPVSTCGQGGSCTAAEVATHNSRSNCWIIVASKAYNVSGYSNHPGGSGVFNSSTCGQDVTNLMASSSSHRHSSSAYSILNSYYVGVVSG